MSSLSTGKRVVLWKVALIVGLGLMPAVCVRGSTVSVADPVALTSNSDNYTTQGNYDWAHYGPVPGSNQSSPLYEHKASGGSISDLSAVGSGTTIAAYVGAGASPSISWSDGSPNATVSLASSSTASEDYTLANSSGHGLQFNALIPAGASETLNMYVNIYNAGTSFPGVSVTATLADGTPTASNTVSPPLGPTSDVSASDNNHEYGVYAIAVSNSQSISENLNVQFTQTSTGSSANIAVWGITATPEPASLGFVGPAALALLARRRTVAQIASAFKHENSRRRRPV